MRLRTSLLLAVLGLVVATIAAAAVTASLVISRAARRQLDDDLVRARGVFRDLVSFRRSLARSEARVMAEEPRLKAIAATEEITHETALGVAFELKGALDSDLFVVIDGDGVLLADAADPKAYGHDMSGNALVARALAQGDAAGFWSDEQHVYQVQAKRLQHGATTVGVVAIGYRLDDRVARAVRDQTDSATAVLLGGRVIAASPLEGDRPFEPAALARAIAGVPEGTTAEVALDGARWLATTVAYPDWQGPGELRFAVLRSIDRALAPSRRLTALLYAIAAGAILASIFAAIFVSRRISRPIDALVGLTREIAAGNLDLRVSPAGATEVRALAGAMNRMAGELRDSRAQLAHKERLEKELEIAAQIQTSILPRVLRVRGFDVAAKMFTASEVGGDYYDVIPVPGGCWIGIGDVAGHGLTAGLVMLMVQSGLASLVRHDPKASPQKLLTILNGAVFENVRDRLQQEEYVTLSLLRCDADGTLTIAGAHQDVLVCPAAGGKSLRLETEGTWVAVVPDISGACPETVHTLARGDLVALYTDGITEALGPGGEMFGLDRLAAALEQARERPVYEVCAHVLEVVRAFSSRRDDDMTLVVVRYLGGEPADRPAPAPGQP